jgi:asparagine synthase (glutamine-hydrolysing)
MFPQVIRHTETPILRTAPVPLHLLSKLVREAGFKVVLTGEGADEALGGYDLFKEAKLRRFWSRQPDSKRRPLLLKQLYPYMKNIQSLPQAYLKAFFQVRPQDLSSPFFSHLPRWELTSKLKAFLSPDLVAAAYDADPISEAEDWLPANFSRWDGFSQAQYLETTGLLPGYILSSQGDRMAMANGIEGRSPFLDVRLLEFAARVPPRFKMAGLNEKHLLKRATRHLVPDSIRQRSKQPYRAPDIKSFFDTETGRARFDYVDEMLSSEAVASAGLFEPEAVTKLVEKARNGTAIGTKDNMALVGILSAQLVFEQLIRGRAVDAGDTQSEVAAASQRTGFPSAI